MNKKKLKIGIIGTRGIPNHYGGFEQFAQFLSVFLAANTHQVFVYNSSNHPYKQSEFEGVQIIHKYDPENRIGTAGQFIYDLNCILDARKRNFDIILQLGYTSSSIWSFLFPSTSVVVTNMDGLEWKRNKYPKVVKSFLRYAEQLAVRKSDFLVADSKGIQTYLQDTYQVSSKFIAYGSSVFNSPNLEVLHTYDLKAFKYNMLIARIEPENNIETILDGVALSSSRIPFVVVGDHTRSPFAKRLVSKYAQYAHILFLGSIYNAEVLDNLRYFSNLYFHGHSVGGTNPSLLEAMGCSCVIVAHQNQFNQSVLEDNAFYFSDPKDVSTAIDTFDRALCADKIAANIEKIRSYYNTQHINQLYLEYFYACLD